MLIVINVLDVKLSPRMPTSPFLTLEGEGILNLPSSLACVSDCVLLLISVYWHVWYLPGPLSSSPPPNFHMGKFTLWWDLIFIPIITALNHRWCPVFNELSWKREREREYKYVCSKVFLGQLLLQVWKSQCTFSILNNHLAHLVWCQLD